MRIVLEPTGGSGHSTNNSWASGISLVRWECKSHCPTRHQTRRFDGQIVFWQDTL